MFSNYDLQVASTVASQLAIAIEGSKHAGETGEILRHRASHLTAMSRIARELKFFIMICKNLSASILWWKPWNYLQAECGTVLLSNQTRLARNSDGLWLYLVIPCWWVVSSMRGILQIGRIHWLCQFADARAPIRVSMPYYWLQSVIRKRFLAWLSPCEKRRSFWRDSAEI